VRRPTATGYPAGSCSHRWSFFAHLHAALTVDGRSGVLQLCRALRRLQTLGDDVGVVVLVIVVVLGVGVASAASPATSAAGSASTWTFEVEQVADRLLLDRLVHGLEEHVALALVLHERVALAIARRPMPSCR
jgi:hypothetical protein